jgi:hypothetical protein
MRSTHLWSTRIDGSARTLMASALCLGRAASQLELSPSHCSGQECAPLVDEPPTSEGAASLVTSGDWSAVGASVGFAELILAALGASESTGKPETRCENSVGSKRRFASTEPQLQVLSNAGEVKITLTMHTTRVQTERV